MNEHKVTPTQVRKPVARHKRSPKHDLTLTAEEIIGMERAAYDRGWKGGSPLLRLLRQQPKKGVGICSRAVKLAPLLALQHIGPSLGIPGRWMDLGTR